jgi:NAD+ synthase (glutamine-hydrolysing)
VIGRSDAQCCSISSPEISPELVPGTADGQPEQRTESTIGPYELQDFNLYYVLRFGFRPSKVAFLALAAWQDKTRGRWPDGDHVTRNQYDLLAIKKYLGIFLTASSAPASSSAAVCRMHRKWAAAVRSPRGDWRAPSDARCGVDGRIARHSRAGREHERSSSGIAARAVQYVQALEACPAPDSR